MDDLADIFIIGGGINGCAIARDAAGRGLTVRLAEMGDLGSGASGNTTKLAHGGLRHMERFEFSRIREAAAERDILMRIAPHLCRPMRFVVPFDKDMRIENDTPASRLLRVVLPWLGGRRPAWLIRMGLGLYAHLGRNDLMAGVTPLDLTGSAPGLPLQDRLSRGWEYSDAWVDDARLVIANARDAEARGAKIMPRTLVLSAKRRDDLWEIEVEDRHGVVSTYRARALVNAAGPWAGKVQSGATGHGNGAGLVRGAHVVVPALFGHDRGYYLQAKDGRYIFVLPYEAGYTLIGTTYVEHPDPDAPAFGTKSELGFLLEFASRYFRRKVSIDDVVWSYAGVRSAPPEEADSSTTASRDCAMLLDDADGVPMLSVYSGRLTTYRKQAEDALSKLGKYFPDLPVSWTANVPLPGGDLPFDGTGRLAVQLATEYPFLGPDWARRMARAYGTEARQILGEAKEASDLGRDFGQTLTERELDWLMEREYALTADDVIWRRTKLGLRMEKHEVNALDSYMTAWRNGVPEDAAAEAGAEDAAAGDQPETVAEETPAAAPAPAREVETAGGVAAAGART
ncbi:glycerol-3-phosphate dehydrogenase [Pseudooceanicola sp. LIPI14-2-Ac024]|uniref:glycerol-3-phosphate dehydrogenase n=1 Tax=Pseudooceanicola sp. LIPI14-2-Ac024 TaxID=3344875 RepID=UPI0035D0015E